MSRRFLVLFLLDLRDVGNILARIYLFYRRSDSRLLGCLRCTCLRFECGGIGLRVLNWIERCCANDGSEGGSLERPRVYNMFLILLRGLVLFMVAIVPIVVILSKVCVVENNEVQ